MGAEDYSYFAREVPSMYFFIGATAAGIDPVTAGQALAAVRARRVGARPRAAREAQVTLDYLHAPPQG